MFGTVIIDAYRKEEALEMADAIDDLCSPTDNYGWASAGIYCFWDYYAEAVLYIGLAGDLAERFKQHNGILPIKEGSKQKQIEDYFSSAAYCAPGFFLCPIAACHSVFSASALFVFVLPVPFPSEYHARLPTL